MNNTEFEVLLSGCEGALRRFVYYKLPSKTDGDDVLQETILAAFNRRDAVRNTDSFKPWILKIAANKCNDFYRERTKRQEIPLDDVSESAISQSRHGIIVTQAVRETLRQLTERDSQILRMFFLQNLPQDEIAKILQIPLGTVKSRLHTAKQRFKSAYPYPPISKGAEKMSKLPEFLPNYTITKSNNDPFPVKWEEMMGWFVVPRIGEKLTYAMYDSPERRRGEFYELAVTGRTMVHGIEGVEITAEEHRGGEHEGRGESRTLTRTFVAQLTDTHCRILAESHYKGEIKCIYTFLDADEFLPNWGFGENNCGNETNLRSKGTIHRDGNKITAADSPFLLDVAGRYDIVIGERQYDTICVMDIECYNNGVVSEQFIDQNGRTVLWRRYNRDDWHIELYKSCWSEKLPDNERLIVNGKTYVHWYDCVTDYIF